MFFNIGAAKGLLKMESIRRLSRPSAWSFMSLPPGMTTASSSHQCFLDPHATTAPISYIVESRSINAHSDLNRLRDYVKLCFCMLYRYDFLLIRECGTDPEWGSVIADQIRWL
ncbi:hypothetical protein BV22DRAFT_396612 [Leucogyrophana mollusca]|uniref:Uncharacterized protein n=1 Tax=Leucogyrophana mollusca TaxID=85980 RepID=A0ACB8BKU5_9AGAM|nr:hypothetical protein BV22DRAFT_396612 [Leucogyrophana mollusca]